MSKRIECPSCQNEVIPRRLFGLDALLKVILTGGLWIIMIPFEKKRCPVCHKIVPGEKPRDDTGSS